MAGGAVAHPTTRTPHYKGGVTTNQLASRCELDNFDNTVQPMHTLAFACPGMDYIRLWPLPMQKPLFEDWWEPVEGEVTF